MLFNPFLGMVPQVFPQAMPQFFGQSMFPSMMGVPQVSQLGMTPASGGVGTVHCCEAYSNHLTHTKSKGRKAGRPPHSANCRGKI